MPERILVTGGAGFVGSHLIEKLVEKRKEVVAFDNSWRGSQKNLNNVKDKIEFIEGDIRDYTSIKNAMKDSDVVFHLASLQGTRFFYEYPDLGLEVGLIGNLNVAKAMKENNAKRVLFTSSSEVYSQPNTFPTQENHPLIIPDPKNPRWSYSATKISGEVIFFSYGRKYGFDTSVVRIHNAYGPRMGWQHVIPEFIKRLVLDEEFTVQGNGSESRSFCYIDDIVDGIISAAFKDAGANEVFNLGNDREEYKIIDLIKMLSQISGKKIKPAFSGVRPEGSATRRLPDISKARKLLGYDSKISLRDGLKLTYNWYKEEIESILKNTDAKEYPWLK